MKKQIAIAALLLSGLGAFAQGYFNFSTTKSYVWDNFTTYGSSVVAPGNVNVAFLWGPASTTPLVGSQGVATNGAATLPSSVTWANILNDPSFHFATNASTSALAMTADVASGITKGAINYNAGSGFQVFATTAGASYTVYVVGWSSAYADPASAALASSPLGISNPFQYSSGATSSSPISQFSGSGMNTFGVVPVPEPSTFALAGLGAAALMIFRRKK